MTAELAPAEASLSYVDASDVEQTRHSRLDRLRAARAAGSTPLRELRPALEPAPDRAARLAADVGGIVLATAQRPIVVVETSQPLAAATGWPS